MLSQPLWTVLRGMIAWLAKRRDLEASHCSYQRQAVSSQLHSILSSIWCLLFAEVKGLCFRPSRDPQLRRGKPRHQALIQIQHVQEAPPPDIPRCLQLRCSMLTKLRFSRSLRTSRLCVGVEPVCCLWTCSCQPFCLIRVLLITFFLCRQVRLHQGKAGMTTSQIGLRSVLMIRLVALRRRVPNEPTFLCLRVDWQNPPDTQRAPFVLEV